MLAGQIAALFIDYRLEHRTEDIRVYRFPGKLTTHDHHPTAFAANFWHGKVIAEQAAVDIGETGQYEQPNQQDAHYRADSLLEIIVPAVRLALHHFHRCPRQ